MKTYDGKGQTISKTNYGVLNSEFFQKPNEAQYSEEKKLRTDSEFRSFFGRIEDTINCFRDLLTFSIFFGLQL